MTDKRCTECNDLLDDSGACAEHDIDERFESLGELVEPADVPALVRAGVEVWSYGYGDDDEFTTLDEADLSDWGPESIEAWGPFRR